MKFSASFATKIFLLQFLIILAFQLPAKSYQLPVDGFSLESISDRISTTTSKIPNEELILNSDSNLLLNTVKENVAPTISGRQASLQLQTLKHSQVFIVPVFVNEQWEPFLLDTGSPNSIIEHQILEELEIEGIPMDSNILAPMVVGDRCPQVNLTVQTLPILTVDAIALQGITGLGLPQAYILGKLSGVLGMDFLKEFDLILHPRSPEMELLPSSSSPADTIPLKGSMGVMTAQFKINGQGPFTFLIDTGADAIVVSKVLAQHLDITQGKEVEVFGFCGSEKAVKIYLEEVKVQNYQQNNLEALIIDGELFEVFGIDGIIGQNFLNQYDQHWRFGKLNELGLPEEGSLMLSIINYDLDFQD